jgi:hypothetical protein
MIMWLQNMIVELRYHGSLYTPSVSKKKSRFISAEVNPNSLWWVHMGISLKERQITEEPMKVKIWKKLLIHKHLV